jgi:hypothetical protein
LHGSDGRLVRFDHGSFPNLASDEHNVLAELEKSTYNFGGPLRWREGQRTAQKEQAT